MAVSLPVRTLLGLALGLSAGAAVGAFVPGATDAAIAFTAPIGTLWLNALKATVVPLVFALLVTGVASAAGAARAGGTAGRAVVIFTGLLLLSAAVTALFIPWLLQVSPAPKTLAAALPPAQGLPGAPAFGDFVAGIVPPNIIAAAADNAMLQVVVGALALGFAVLALPPEKRAALTGLMDALADAMLVIVGWIILLAPIGVAALAFSVGAKTGFGAAGALLHYVVFVSLACIVVTLVSYLVAWRMGRVPLLAFARAVAPAQAVAIGTQSSLASLPVMVQSAHRLGVPEPVTRMVLPLAVATFRITSPAANLAVVLYCANLFGVEYSWGQLAVAVLVAAVMSLTVVGLPSQSTFFAPLVAISAPLGVPLEALPLLIAVETLPDIWRTVGNVTADVAATTAVSSRERPESTVAA